MFLYEHCTSLAKSVSSGIVLSFPCMSEVGKGEHSLGARSEEREAERRHRERSQPRGFAERLLNRRASFASANVIFSDDGGADGTQR